MDTERVMKLLVAANALKTNDHFVYTSGLHGSEYVLKDALYLHTHDTSEICKMLALEFDNMGVEVVAAPAMGGIILSHSITFHLQTLNMDRPGTAEILSVYAEKVGEKGKERFAFTRGYDKVLPGKRVLVVEDLLNTGGSALEIVELVRSLGGEVIGVGALLNRGKVTAAQVGGVPKLACAGAVDMKAYDAADCPLCAAKIPINTEVGHGRKFVAQHGQPS